ncbi:ROK family transcriptional regulator [Actinoallomurus rhizosphaericola]|uniref:ROK family transcriptional regulator n=1 Tax=Actinoallomurus rhizosphaericola TaxID=2952536 RepID=UPI002092CD67|nr:ROK family transcriptional regulator [Actinoallomurus rhizosphaericola]MCO5995359.1 ROK family transcriptional regulator [Actinoallomurus rhizosphaericola]
MIETPLNLREVGRLRVLQALFDADSTSRSEIVQVSGLSRATVSSVVADLLAAGLVEESEPDAQARSTGRPAQSLTLCASAAYALGADIGHQHVRVALCDLSGTPVWNDGVAKDVDHAPGETLDLAAEMIHRALRERGIDRSRVLGLGIDIAAPVRDPGGVLEAHGIMPGWIGVQPGAELERRTGLTTWLANDADAGALAERKYGAGRNVDDMIYVRLSAGIGAGIIAGGRHLHGTGGLAGEIGHIRSLSDGRVCRCGNRGCLETVAGPDAITRLLTDSWGHPVTVPDLLSLVQEGDRGAIRALEDAAEEIGRVLANLVTLLNPELIVVGGDLAPAGEILFEAIGRVIRRYALAPSAESVRVVQGSLGDQAEVLGAAGLVLADAPRLLATTLAR